MPTHTFLHCAKCSICHILGLDTPRNGAYILKFKLSQDLCTVHLPPSFIILCFTVQKLSCSQTYKEIWLKTSTSASVPPQLQYTMMVEKEVTRQDKQQHTNHLWRVKRNNHSLLCWWTFQRTSYTCTTCNDKSQTATLGRMDSHSDWQQCPHLMTVWHMSLTLCQ